ncbi:hypothetical protein Ddc_00145 [Ditylenchus destructor]|nr:hypothetical protein Ddc_00145 [Ditylenchus destructor]
MNIAITMYLVVIAMTFLPTGEMAAQSKLARDVKASPEEVKEGETAAQSKIAHGDVTPEEVKNNTDSGYKVVSPRNGNGPICVAKETDLTELKISCEEQIPNNTPEGKSAAPKEDKATHAGLLARIYVLIIHETQHNGTKKEWKPILDTFFSEELREKILLEAGLNQTNSLLRKATTQNRDKKDQQEAHEKPKEVPTQS